MKYFVRISLLAAVSMWGTALHAGPELTYNIASVTMTDLGTMGGRSSEAADINDAGNIVGWSDSYAGPGVRHAFFYRAGHFIDVGFSRWSTRSYATGLNNSNVVVGNLEFGLNVAFRWYEGALHELRVSLSPHARVGTTAEAISDAGLITGTRDYPDFDYYQLATVWTDDVTFHTLNNPGNPWGSTAYDINANGQVVGNAGVDSFRWQFDPAVSPSSSSGIPPQRASCNVAIPYAINRWGMVVGYAGCSIPGDPSMQRAFLWNGMTTNSLDLGLYPGGTRAVALDINDSSFVAGAAGRRVRVPDTTRSVETDIAFIYHADFGLRMLPTLPGTVGDGKCKATALNNISVNNIVQVVGYCDTVDQNSPRHAVRWDVTLLRR